ncbi:hypothetical protein LSH36_485g02010 [Paralvinella palmiformis]|uniref:Uncharacterized protein n=1 Tax=Paralvinella palmiformis TaxID=53620 RepID=A0AAD9J9H5_9ANNE|nr:hypothetical protein LSH36_485g02010 [Paralvinella palmiformis]
MTIALFWQVFSLIAYGAWLKKDDDVIRKRGMTFDGKLALVFNCLAALRQRHHSDSCKLSRTESDVAAPAEQVRHGHRGLAHDVNRVKNMMMIW